jgi:predicted dehydrogenase
MALLQRDAREIRVVVAGIGKMGTYHVRALLQLTAGEAEDYYKAGLREQVGKIRLCGLCDIDQSRAVNFPGIPCLQDYRAMIEAAKPDMVVVATPSRLHYGMARAALEAGLHVFVEKPVTTRLSDWDDLAGRADLNGLRIMAGHVERYNPVAIKVKHLLASGELTVSGYGFNRCQPYDPRIPDDIVTDKVIHDLDLAMFLFGPVAGVDVRNFKQVRGETREVTLRLRHDSGISGELHLSWLVEGRAKVRECSLLALDGQIITGDFMAKTLQVNGREVECCVPGWIRADNNQVKDELADFVGYCLEPDSSMPVVQPLLTVPEIRAATAIIEKLSDDIRLACTRSEGRCEDV